MNAPGHVHPTQDDQVVRSLSEVVGGPMGTRGGGHRWWTPVRVVLAMAAVCFALGLVQKAPCVQDRWASDDVRYGQMCYSDLPYLYTGRGFAELAWPYTGDAGQAARYQAMEYPVGISYWAWYTAWVTQQVTGSPDLDERRAVTPDSVHAMPGVDREQLVFVAVNAIGFAALALLAAWFLTGVNPGRPWDAAGFALAPTLLLTGLINWDLLAVALVCGALWAWTRGSPALTGLMIGLGTAVKLYPVFLLGALLVICLRQRRYAELAIATGAAAASWLVLNAPAYLSSPERWRVFWTFNSDRGADWGSPWLMVQQFTPGTFFSVDTINHGSLLFFGLWCVLVLLLGLAAPETPRLAQLGFLLVAGFLLVNKVYSPQYVLWLLPLAAMARPRWRDLLIWQAGEILYFAGVWWHFLGVLAPASGNQTPAYALLIAARLAAEIYLVAVVVRDVLRPEHDPVRATSDDLDPVEPGGGEADPDLEPVADVGHGRALG